MNLARALEQIESVGYQGQNGFEALERRLRRSGRIENEALANGATSRTRERPEGTGRSHHFVESRGTAIKDLQGTFGSEVARRESRTAGGDNESGETLGHGEECCGDGIDPVGDDAAIVDPEVCFLQTRLKTRSGAILAPSVAHRVRDGQNFRPMDHKKRVGDSARCGVLRSLTRRSVKLVMDDARSFDDRDHSDREAPLTGRTLASSRVAMLESTARQVQANSLKKGDVLGAARYAGVQAAKATASYLPLFEPVLTRDVVVNFEVGVDYVDVRVEVPGDGLEAWMPALTAATVASLTIFDMCKAVDRTMTIGPVELVNAG